MNKQILYGVAKPLVLCVTVFLAGIYMTKAQEAHVGEQVVFKLDHRDSRGRYVMEAQEVRIAYTVVPIEGSHPAPLSNDTLMICRPYNEGPAIFLRCGPDRYAVNNIGLIPKKEK